MKRFPELVMHCSQARTNAITVYGDNDSLMRGIFTRSRACGQEEKRGGGGRGRDRVEFRRHSGIDYLVLLQSPAGVDDVYNYYVSRMRV